MKASYSLVIMSASLNDCMLTLCTTDYYSTICSYNSRVACSIRSWCVSWLFPNSSWPLQSVITAADTNKVSRLDLIVRQRLAAEPKVCQSHSNVRVMSDILMLFGSSQITSSVWLWGRNYQILIFFAVIDLTLYRGQSSCAVWVVIHLATLIIVNSLPPSNLMLQCTQVY